MFELGILEPHTGFIMHLQKGGILQPRYMLEGTFELPYIRYGIGNGDMGPVGRCDCVPSCDRGGVGARYGFMPVALRRSRSVGRSVLLLRSLHVRDGNMGDGRTDGQTDADGHKKRSRLSSPPEFDLARSLAELDPSRGSSFVCSLLVRRRTLSHTVA